VVLHQQDTSVYRNNELKYDGCFDYRQIEKNNFPCVIHRVADYLEPGAAMGQPKKVIFICLKTNVSNSVDLLCYMQVVLSQ
jgi:hypothetical protein